MSESLVDLIFSYADSQPEKNALFAKKKGVYAGISYREMREEALYVSHALSEWGVEEGDYVALLSNNRPEWVYWDLGTMSRGAALVPIYPTLAAKEVEYILNKTKAKVVVFEDASQLIPLEETLKACSSLTRIVCIDHCESAIEQCKSLSITAYDSCIAASKDAMGDTIDSYYRSCPTLTRKSVASIVFTSGTTGPPKGVVLTHGNFLSDLEAVYKAVPILNSEIVLSFLPLSHVFERTAGYYVILGKGATIYYAENMDTISANIQECQPTALISVPRLYEKIRARVLGNLKGAKKPIFYWALSVGKKMAAARKARKVSALLACQHKIAHALVYKKVQARTGGRLRFFVSGGAPLSEELGQFFEALGLIILEGYGMTETSPVATCNRLDNYKFGTVGKALDGVEVHIANDGELLIRGPIVMQGYLDEPDKTNEVIDEDGWLHTGDIATIDSDGFVSIVDRKKDLIILSNGKNVAPQPIELSLKESSYISQAILMGDKHNFVSALIIPDWDALLKAEPFPEARTETPDTLVKSPLLLALIKQEVDHVNAKCSRYEQVKKFALLAHEFTQEKGELTPSLKPKRPVIRNKYKVTIDQLYNE